MASRRAFSRFARPLSASAAALGAASVLHQRGASCRSSRTDDDPLSRYTVGKVLGEGAFAVVKLVTSKATAEAFALKMIDKKWTLPDAMERELAILRAIGRHRHVVSLVEDFELSTHYGVVLELANGGDAKGRHPRAERVEALVSVHIAAGATAEGDEAKLNCAEDAGECGARVSQGVSRRATRRAPREAPRGRRHLIRGPTDTLSDTVPRRSPK